jgi:hypothetical protein
MLTDTHPEPTQVIVATEDCAGRLVTTLCAHHRAFPEVRGEGETPRMAAERLIARLTLALDRAGGHWQRTYIERAIEDVRTFAEQAPHKGP